MSSLMYTFRFDIGQCVYPGALTFNTTDTMPFQVVGRVVEQCTGGTKGIYILRTTKGIYILRTPTLILLQVAEWEVISFSEAETIVRLNTLDKKKEERAFWKELSTGNAKTEPERDSPPIADKIRDQQKPIVSDTFPDPNQAENVDRPADPLADISIWGPPVIQDQPDQPDQPDKPTATILHTNNAEQELWKQGIDTWTDQPDQADQPKKPWEECPPGFERTE